MNLVQTRSMPFNRQHCGAGLKQTHSTDFTGPDKTAFIGLYNELGLDDMAFNRLQCALGLIKNGFNTVHS